MSQLKTLNGMFVLQLRRSLLILLHRSNENHRQAKQFKKCIYIAFSEWSDDLRLIDDDEEGFGSDNDVTMSSESPEDSDVDVKVR
jgi:hypothetical protein